MGSGQVDRWARQWPARSCCLRGEETEALIASVSALESEICNLRFACAFAAHVLGAIDAGDFEFCPLPTAFCCLPTAYLPICPLPFA